MRKEERQKRKEKKRREKKSHSISGSFEAKDGVALSHEVSGTLPRRISRQVETGRPGPLMQFQQPPRTWIRSLRRPIRLVGTLMRAVSDSSTEAEREAKFLARRGPTSLQLYLRREKTVTSARRFPVLFHAVPCRHKLYVTQ